MHRGHQTVVEEGTCLRQNDRSEAIPTEYEYKTSHMPTRASCQCLTPTQTSRMKLTTASLVALAVTVATTSAVPVKRAAPQGIDVSHYQGAVNFAAAAANGISFAYIKATEGTSGSLQCRSPLRVPEAYHSPCTFPSLPRSRVLHQLRRSHQRRYHPWRVPLRAPGRLVWSDASAVLPCPRGRVVQRWHHSARCS